MLFELTNDDIEALTDAADELNAEGEAAGDGCYHVPTSLGTLETWWDGFVVGGVKYPIPGYTVPE